MPTITYKRLWCSTCKEWELFSYPFGKNGEWECKKCKTPHEDVPLVAIPKDKKEEQRIRYKQAYNKQAEAMIHNPLMNMGMGLAFPLSEKWPDPEIIESDAGQKAIDKIKEQKYKEEYENRKEAKRKKQEEYQKFAKLGRNDTCACGSGLKYKKCCLSKFN